MSEQYIKDANELTAQRKDAEKDSKLTMNYVLEQIENIATQTEYLNQAISELRRTDTEEGSDNAYAISEIVKSRETTNQKLLALYEKMYDGLKPVASIKEKALMASLTAILNGNKEGFSNVMEVIDSINR